MKVEKTLQEIYDYIDNNIFPQLIIGKAQIVTNPYSKVKVQLTDKQYTLYNYILTLESHINNGYSIRGVNLNELYSDCKIYFSMKWNKEYRLLID